MTRGLRQQVLRGAAHDRGLADELGEPTADGEVAAVSLAQHRGVASSRCRAGPSRTPRAISSAAISPVSIAYAMPSPLNGFTAPAASPTSSMPGTACGTRLRLIGSGPDSTRPSAVSSSIPHSGGQHRRERVEQPLGRDVLEVLEGVEQPGAEVDPAAGHREQPAVARQQQVALPQVEPRLEPRSRVIASVR